ncbi:lipopolysaccharide kinase InaA family protein [Psychroflexus sediminis]|uniref:Lipopolysaccharide kinase (Kdo/WaaP) family protein n=1 Tax=Psychroflexus sediminis TaxID=470826 RepID=A0A1G7WYK5_9FLAO|nr:lipopolysaccharide kinase InaA family protein [Psychroflexus sediminis]SDG76400.1 Lipopolysaccharide kinase (Kdo/WaaP) family protein [Psychroflexus sediminis]
MSYKVSKNFENHLSSILDLINTFDSIGTVFGNSDRNVIKTVDFEGLTLNIKSFKEPHFINQIAYQYFRKSKARRSFEYATILKEKGVATPNPIAYFEFKKGIGFGKSFYISEHLTPDLTYRELVHQPGIPNHEHILRAFTRFTFQLHEKGVEFQDHSPGNTLIFLGEDKIKFSLVDLNRMKFKELNFQERMFNFRRLTPKKDMVEVMSDEYAKLIDKPKAEVFKLMWEFTSEFQRKFHQKQKRKKKIKSLF